MKNETTGFHPSWVSSVALLRRCIGRAVTLMRHDRYFFNGKPDDTNAGSLEITFDDSSVITLQLNSDGESSRVTDEPLCIMEEFELEHGAHCTWQEHRLTDQPEWSKLIGCTLDGAEAIQDRIGQGEAFISGWCLRFSKGQTVVYYNCGDDARILLNNLPPQESYIATNYVSLDDLEPWTI